MIGIYTKKRGSEDGFTILELLIATTIFSFILLIATTGIIRIGQLYYKGVTESKTQETIRNVSDELTRSIQFANGSKTSLPDSGLMKSFCLGDTRYVYYFDLPYQTTNNAGLIAERLGAGSNCASDVAIDTRQLLGKNMRLLKFDVETVPGNDKAWQVNIRIAYGDNDLLDHYDDGGVLKASVDPDNKINREKAICKTGLPGGSFCAVARLDTIVKKRLN